jgi:LmbE family N-acetylglucosaminyl deacetylase
VFDFPFFGEQSPRRVLALGSHSDDIEIGCGATILALTRGRPDLDVTWVVLGAEGAREEEARASASAFLESAGSAEVIVHGFRDGFFPYIGAEVKDRFEELKASLEPELILTHARHDLHQDHRLVCELTWNTWRDHLILEYEIPKYDGDLGVPNVFVPVAEELAHEEAKLVRCTAGAIFDVALDLRSESATFRAWFGTTLSAGNRRALYIPEGCAHGFLTLEDATEVLYQISAFYAPDAARGVRWDDPAFEIAWPGDVRVISERDRTYPDFVEETTGSSSIG